MHAHFYSSNTWRNVTEMVNGGVQDIEEQLSENLEEYPNSYPISMLIRTLE